MFRGIEDSQEENNPDKTVLDSTRAGLSQSQIKSVIVKTKMSTSSAKISYFDCDSTRSTDVSKMVFSTLKIVFLIYTHSPFPRLQLVSVDIKTLIFIISPTRSFLISKINVRYQNHLLVNINRLSILHNTIPLII